MDAIELKEKTTIWLANCKVGNFWLIGTKVRLTERVEKLAKLTGISELEIRSNIIADAKLIYETFVGDLPLSFGREVQI